MKKKISNSENAENGEMLPEYDFSKMSGGVRGKYYRAMQTGYTITTHKADGTTEVQKFAPENGTIVLEPDVKEYFPDSEAVNSALRSLIALIPKKPNQLGNHK